MAINPSLPSSFFFPCGVRLPNPGHGSVKFNGKSYQPMLRRIIRSISHHGRQIDFSSVSSEWGPPSNNSIKLASEAPHGHCPYGGILMSSKKRFLLNCGLSLVQYEDPGFFLLARNKLIQHEMIIVFHFHFHIL